MFVSMTAFFKVRLFTYHVMLLKVLSTVNLAGCEGLRATVRLSFNTIHLASFRRLYYLAARGLSHFNITLGTSLRFYIIVSWI